jgi:hypothetical protein
MWLAPIISIVVVAFVVKGPLSPQFSPSRWVDAATTGSDINERWRMMGNLAEDHQLLGMTYREVCTLLGPDVGGNCETFDPSRAAVRVHGRSQGVEETPPGGPCTSAPSESGVYSTFGGLAPHFVYKVRDTWAIRALGDERTYLVLIFCEEGVVDKWILERED